MAILTHNGTKSHNTQVMWQWLMISKSLDFSQFFFLIPSGIKKCKSTSEKSNFLFEDHPIARQLRRPVRAVTASELRSFSAAGRAVSAGRLHCRPKTLTIVIAY